MYIAKMVNGILIVFKQEIDEKQLKPFSIQGLIGDYSDFFMYGNEIVSKNEDKLRSFVAYRNRLSV